MKWIFIGIINNAILIPIVWFLTGVMAGSMVSSLRWFLWFRKIRLEWEAVVKDTKTIRKSIELTIKKLKSEIDDLKEREDS